MTSSSIDADEVVRQANPFIDIDPHETIENVREGLALIAMMATWTNWKAFSGSRSAISGLYRHVESMRAALAYERDRVEKGVPPFVRSGDPDGGAK